MTWITISAVGYGIIASAFASQRRSVWVRTSGTFALTDTLLIPFDALVGLQFAFMSVFIGLSALPTVYDLLRRVSPVLANHRRWSTHLPETSGSEPLSVDAYDLSEIFGGDAPLTVSLLEPEWLDRESDSRRRTDRYLNVPIAPNRCHWLIHMHRLRKTPNNGQKYSQLVWNWDDVCRTVGRVIRIYELGVVFAFVGCISRFLLYAFVFLKNTPPHIRWSISFYEFLATLLFLEVWWTDCTVLVRKYLGLTLSGLDYTERMRDVRGRLMQRIVINADPSERHEWTLVAEERDRVFPWLTWVIPHGEGVDRKPSTALQFLYGLTPAAMTWLLNHFRRNSNDWLSSASIYKGEFKEHIPETDSFSDSEYYRWMQQQEDYIVRFSDGQEVKLRMPRVAAEALTTSNDTLKQRLWCESLWPVFCVGASFSAYFVHVSENAMLVHAISLLSWFVSLLFSQKNMLNQVPYWFPASAGGREAWQVEEATSSAASHWLSTDGQSAVQAANEGEEVDLSSLGFSAMLDSTG